MSSIQESSNSNLKVYQGPLQGFTDYVYRKAHSELFTGVHKYFIPYIHLDKQGVLSKKFIRETARINNPQEIVIPQVLCNSAAELVSLDDYLADLGYSEINLNMGCPYPMVALKGKGSGQLKDALAFRKLLEAYYANNKLKLSLKLRLGYEQSDDVFKVLEVANDFPIEEIIIHPRIGKQLYKGTVDLLKYRECLNLSRHEIVYNGDINSIEDFELLRKEFPRTNKLMIGRGLLMNPFLAKELITSAKVNHGQKQHYLMVFHESVYDMYKTETDPSNLLNKMKQFWVYFSHQFKDQAKVLKRIKKLNNPKYYDNTVSEIFVKYL